MPPKNSEQKIELKLNSKSINLGKDAVPYSQKGSSNKEVREQIKKIISERTFAPEALPEKDATSEPQQK